MAYDTDNPTLDFTDPKQQYWDQSNDLYSVEAPGFDLPNSQFVGEQLQSTAASLPQLDFYELATKLCLNRADNTGGGAAFVYWISPTFPDTAGSYYNGVVPFSQLTNIMCAAVVSP